MKKIITLLCSLVLVSCSTYSHKRVTADGTIENTHATGFISKAAIAGLSSETIDGTYSRKVAVKKLSGSTELEKLGPLLETVFEAMVQGMVQGMKDTK